MFYFGLYWDDIHISTETHACSPRGCIPVASEDINHWGNSEAPLQSHRRLSNQREKVLSFFWRSKDISTNSDFTWPKFVINSLIKMVIESGFHFKWRITSIFRIWWWSLLHGRCTRRGGYDRRCRTHWERQPMTSPQFCHISRRNDVII